MSFIRVSPAKHAVQAALSFPGDKSLSHRAILFGSLAEGVSRFKNVLSGEDCVCTRRAFQAMGVAIREVTPTELEISGSGPHALKAPAGELNLGNSGTSMRLLLGVLAGQDFEAVLTGDASLSSRPMKRVTDPLRRMGARVEGRQDANFAPLRIGGGSLRGIAENLAIASAQVKSALLLAGLYARGRTCVTEPVLSRDHTERFLEYFGARVERHGLTVCVEGGQTLRAVSFDIAGDVSSAAFFCALALLWPKAKLEFHNVLWNATRTGFFDVLKRMGVGVELRSQGSAGPEPTADFTLVSSGLRAFEIRPEELPSVIDEIPVLTVLATQAEGETVIHDAAELRVKESDRIASMAEALSRLGADIRVVKDTMRIKGPTPLRGARVHSRKDHRVAMSMVVAGLAAEGETVVEDTDCIRTSFPGFLDMLKGLGARCD